MKKNTTYRYFGVLWLTLVIFVFSTQNLKSQSPADFEVALNMTYVKASDGSRVFRVTLIGEGEKDKIPVYKGEVNFYNVLAEQKTLLGKATTDINGKATFTCPATQQLMKDETGLYTFSAEFTGQGDFGSAEASISVKDLKMTIELVEEDSVKSIIVKAFSYNEKNEEVPLEEIPVNFYIQAMLSRLKIGDGTFAGGECTFEFPSDLKGDEVGNLKIFAAVEEDDNFGNVEVMKEAKWGSHRLSSAEEKGELWTSGPPRWMVITLTILLVGVWSHYFYAIIQIWLIRIEGKKLEKKSKKIA